MGTFLCNFDGPLLWAPETENDYATVGMICNWGGVTIATISDEVPDGEANDYAALFAAAPELYEALSAAEWSAKKQGQGSGFMGSGGNGPLVAACPSCVGICPEDQRKNEFMARVHGHGDNCALDKALAKARGEQP